MKKTYIVFKNSEGLTTRVVPFRGEALELIYRHDTRRIEFVSAAGLKELEEKEISFQNLADVAKNSAPGETIYKGPMGRVEHVAEINQTLGDVQVREDKDPKDFTYFLKWTASIQVAALALCIGISAIFNYFTKEEVEVVTVFKQVEPIEKKTQVVQMTEKKKTQKKNPEFVKPKKSNETKIAKNRFGKSKGTNMRSGDQLSRMGALSALGGMNKNSSGLGGLSQSKSRSQGFGFDGTRAAGGNNRGMLGKGMIQAGIGGGETMQGYGGYGTKGKGSGQAGYGHVGMAGRSGGYYLPLSDEATVEGGLDPDQVQAVVERNQGQMIYCYEKAIQSQPNLKGRVAVKFIVSPSGSVSVANIAQSSVNSSKIESCILSKLRAWKFPRPKGNVAVNVVYPFAFKR
ncbi:MAG: AgmX/PglI C-terminal domain-containing protein, partial [Bdellovibrionota bacterium]